MICCCSQIPVPSLIREFCDFSRGFLWCQSYTEEIREYFYGVLIHSSDFQTSEQGIKCCPMNINWYTTYYVREIWHNINTQMKHSNTETNYCLDIKTVSKKNSYNFDIVIVTLVGSFWQIIISYCKFLMPRPLKWGIVVVASTIILPRDICDILFFGNNGAPARLCQTYTDHIG